MKHQPAPLLNNLTTANQPGQVQAEQPALAAAHPRAAERHPQPRTLLVISAEVKQSIHPEIAAGRYPRKDYFELANALQADILDWTAISKHADAHLLARIAGKSLAHAWLAFRQRSNYQIIYTDSERVGIPLTVLLKLARSRNQHIMLAHLLSPWKKRLWFRWGHLHTHITTILCHSSLQRHIMIEQLRIPAEKIKLIPYQVDERFWRPMSPQEAQAALNEPSAPKRPADERANSSTSAITSAPTTPIICSVGLEYRDYPTLIEAVRGLDVQLEIAAASHWSTHRSLNAGQSLPPNVSITAHQYLSLRHLYASSQFVVVPLIDVPNQAGITTILEAMAMGKAVIVSGTRGQTDTVRDRRNHGLGRIDREVLPGFLDAPEVSEELRHLATGFYVRPGDAAELRNAITYLLAHPHIADELGRNGRRVFAALMTLDAFTARIVQIIQAAHQPSGA